MLSLTEQAKEVIKGIVEESGRRPACGSPHQATETAIPRSTSTLAPAPGEGDEVVEDDGAKVFLDEAAAAVLADKTLDVEEHGDHFHFSLGERDERPEVCR